MSFQWVLLLATFPRIPFKNTQRKVRCKVRVFSQQRKKKKNVSVASAVKNTGCVFLKSLIPNLTLKISVLNSIFSADSLH